MSAAVANPAFITLASAFDISVVEASYSLTMYIVFAGVGPLLLIPLANIYGRRPVYLIGSSVGAITNIAAGYSPTWAGVLVTRAINGIAAGAPGALGAATICDLYFLHERGFYMGIFTLFLTNGPHVAPLMGGFLAEYLSWNWCYRVPVSRSSSLYGWRCQKDEKALMLILTDRASSNWQPSPSTSPACPKRCIPAIRAKRTIRQTPTSTSSPSAPNCPHANSS